MNQIPIHNMYKYRDISYAYYNILYTIVDTYKNIIIRRYAKENDL